MTDFQQVLDAALTLSPEDRGRLVDRLLDDLVPATADVKLTDAMIRELDRRLADIETHPDDEVSWEQVKAEALEDIRRCRSG
jgi:putative addiction module component (TIGR02574 family)